MTLFSGRGFTTLSSLLYMFLIIVTIPLAFDVGGEDCGIAFTGTLSLFYLILSTFRILAQNTNFKYIMSTLYHLQPIIIPSLLILHLSLFSVTTKSPVFLPLPASNDPIFKVWLSLSGPWRWFVKNATPLFTTMEGFCTLLVIQTAGRLATWLIRKRSDSWIIPLLLFSSCVFSSSLYFLYRIYTFPVTISLASATLIGAVLTVSVFLALFGIVSGRGNSVESSLLLSYIVYCLYFTFTDFQSSFSAETFLYFFASSTRPDIPPLPPVIINGYTNLVSNIASLAPTAFKTVFQFLHGAVSTVTPSVFVSLSYRLAVFWASTRIIPAVHQVSAHALSRTQSMASLSSSASSQTLNVSINSTQNIPKSNRIRKIRSSTFDASLENPSNKSASAGATSKSSLLENGIDSKIQNHQLGETNLSQTGLNQDPFSDDHPSTSSFKFPHHIKTYSDESAVTDDSDQEDFLASSNSAMSSSTTIASNAELYTCGNRNNKSFALSNSQPENIQHAFYGDDSLNQDMDDLKEKYISYSFNDHYNRLDSTFNDYEYEEYQDFSEKSLYKTQSNGTQPGAGLETIKGKSNTVTLQFLIIAYGPCILIAVYTHLLIQHLAIFNTISNEYSTTVLDQVTWSDSKFILVKDALVGIWQWSRSWVSTPRDSWQFWGWVNMFSTLALYAAELVYGKGANEDIIEYHWKCK